MSSGNELLFNILKKDKKDEIEIKPKSALATKTPEEKAEETKKFVLSETGQAVVDERSPASFVDDMLKKNVSVEGILAVASQIREGKWVGRVKLILEAKGLEVPKKGLRFESKKDEDQDDEEADGDGEEEEETEEE